MNRLVPCPPRAGYFAGTDLKLLAKGLRQGEFSSVQLVGWALQAIEQLNPELNAVVCVAAQASLLRAEEADRQLMNGIDLGPLHGIPVGIKDNILTADMPTTMGSAHFLGYQSDKDAVCVDTLRQAGAIILAKTATHEFAYGPTGDCAIQGATGNAWDSSRMAGGSSCGSAVAVASGMLPIALGTDTGGSVRIPAALNGITGFKPGYGHLSMAGVFPLSKTLDHLGVLARNVADAATVVSVLAGMKAGTPASQVVSSRPRIGWIPAQYFGAADADIIQVVEGALTQALGVSPAIAAQVQEHVEDLHMALGRIQKSEAFEVHAERVAEQPEKFQAQVLERLLLSRDVRGWEYVRGLHTRTCLQQSFAALFEHFDFLCMPTIAVRTPKLHERQIQVEGENVVVREALLSLTSPWNLLGLPAVSLPCGMLDGLPVGLQIIAPADDVTRLAEFAGSLQEKFANAD